MPKIESEIFIPASLETVYEIAKDIERFPEFFPDVESVTILERTPEGFTSEWVGVVEKLHRKLKWRELDVWDDSTHTCTFRAIGGDWDKYDGVWTFTTQDGGTRMQMQLECDINVPMIGAIIKGLIGKLAKANVDNMFAGIRRRALGEI
ncbi:MAG TPA: SRPBCC family protein [Armatimonadota bacterium]|jgi:ribosome-associated toxin RatA of RatAB toxin-antitoxin module